MKLHCTLVEHLADGMSSDLWSPRSMEQWSAEIRTHVADCPICQVHLHLDFGLANSFRDDTEELPAAPVASILRRARSHKQPERLSTFTASTESFPEAVYRSAAPDPAASTGALDVSRTENGLRAWDPDARWIAAFLLSEGSPWDINLLCSKQARTTGVSVDVAVAPEHEVFVVVFTTREPGISVLTMQWWLEDNLSAAVSPKELESLASSDSVHARVIRLAPKASKSLLELRPDRLPPKSDAVTTLMKAAAAAGRNGTARQASALYQDALHTALNTGDESGAILATIGLAHALRIGGYRQDAHDLLVDLIEEYAVDHQVASRLCGVFVREALDRSDFVAAQRWVEDGLRFAPNDWWTRAYGADLDARRGRYRRAIMALEGTDWSALHRESEHAWRLLLALWAARSEQLSLAVHHLEQCPSAFTTPALTLHRLRADTALAQAREERVDWPAMVEQVRRRLQHSGMPDAETRRLVLEFANDAFSAGADTACTQLMFCGLCVGPEASRDGSRLAAASTSGGLLLAGSNRRPKRLKLSSAEIQNWVRRASEEVERGEAAEGLQALGVLLTTESQSPPTRLLISSDGCLTGAPIEAALASVSGNQQAPAVAVCLRASALKSPRTRRGLSLADARGDLPLASNELFTTEALVALQGAEATTNAFRQHCEQPWGIIHLGLHAHRERGLPVLAFYDRSLSPMDIEILNLQGDPVVLLAGCATGERIHGRGGEHSLGKAFLVAGASAVVATRWPLTDKEASSLFQTITAHWTGNDIVAAVASAVETLRRCGASPRVWGAAVVYH